MLFTLNLRIKLASARSYCTTTSLGQTPKANLTTWANIPTTFRIVFVASTKKRVVSGYALISGHPGRVTPRNPRSLAQRRLQIPRAQSQYRVKKSY